MSLKAGDRVFFRPLSSMVRFSAVIDSVDTGIVVLKPNAFQDISEGDSLVVSGRETEYYTRVIAANNNLIKLKIERTESREYFRVDDVFPVVSKKVDETDICRKKTLTPYNETADRDISSDVTNAQLLKMLIQLNEKMDRILKGIDPNCGVVDAAEEKHVNISASGMRFKVNECFKKGEIVEVTMMLPTSPPSKITACGKVVRTNELRNGDYEIALHFSDIDECSREKIIQYTINRHREIILNQKKETWK